MVFQQTNSMSIPKRVSLRTRRRQFLESYSICSSGGSLLSTRFCSKGVPMGAVLASLCCGLDEFIQRTRASQHCTDYCLHVRRRLNQKLKYYMAVAAVQSWVSEGVLNNLMDDDRLLRNNPDCWQSFLQDVCFVENVSQFTCADVGRAGWRRDDSRLVEKRRCPCCACMQRVHGDEVLWRHVNKKPWALCFGDIDSNFDLLGSSRG